MTEDKKAADNEKARIRKQRRRYQLKAEPANGRNVTRILKLSKNRNARRNSVLE